MTVSDMASCRIRVLYRTMKDKSRADKVSVLGTATHAVSAGCHPAGSTSAARSVWYDIQPVRIAAIAAIIAYGTLPAFTIGRRLFFVVSAFGLILPVLPLPLRAAVGLPSARLAVLLTAPVLLTGVAAPAFL